MDHDPEVTLPVVSVRIANAPIAIAIELLGGVEDAGVTVGCRSEQENVRMIFVTGRRLNSLVQRFNHRHHVSLVLEHIREGLDGRLAAFKVRTGRLPLWEIHTLATVVEAVLTAGDAM